MANPYFSVVPGGRLQTPAGQPFTAVIVNYVGHSDRAWEQFQPGKFDAALIEADFRLARRAGANVIRTFVDDPLQGEFPKGDWTKLDALLRAAEQAGVYLLLALADYNLSYVQTLAAHAGLIAARYAGREVIMAYDLKNEPRFNDLLFLHYPAPLALLAEPWTAPGLPARSKSESVAWARGEGKAPAWFDDDQAERYAAARAALDGCQRAISDFTAARGFSASAAEFVRSPEAAPWQSFLGALNATLAAWLAPQLAPIRAADGGRPITVAYSDPLLAALPANSALDLISTNRYPRDNSARQLEFQLAVTGGLRAAFPGKPVLLTELGFATYEMDAGRASAAESAGWLRALELGLAGIGKWMLWDLPPGPNPVERSFGLFDAAGAPKPAVYALAAVAGIARSARGPLGRAALGAAPGGEITYTYAADGVRAAGGISAAGDDALRWEGGGWGQVTGCVARPGEIIVQTVAPGQITLDLGQLIGLGAAPPDVSVTAGGAPVAFTAVGTTLRFAAAPGAPVVCRATLAAVDARIVIVWPHGGAPVAEARLANLTAYLTFGDTRMSVPCDFDRPVVLWRALNNEPAVPVAAGVRRLAEADGRQVPAWDFNDVDVSAARDPKNKIYFTLQVEGLPYRSNAWAHGGDARTFMPQQVQPTGHVVGTLGNPPAELDARIQILWPHGNAPVAEARLANLTADLFQHGTLVRVTPQLAASEMNPPPDLATWQPAVWLLRALDNGVGQRVARGVMRREKPAGPASLAPARWDFNDVDISAAREAQHKLHFWVEVTGMRTYSNFWTHGADARTYLPNPETPLGDCRA